MITQDKEIGYKFKHIIVTLVYPFFLGFCQQ